MVKVSSYLQGIANHGNLKLLGQFPQHTGRGRESGAVARSQLFDTRPLGGQVEVGQEQRDATMRTMRLM
jgi:hypothetical protein